MNQPMRDHSILRGVPENGVDEVQEGVALPGL